MALNNWTGAANDGNWATGGNWSLGSAPVATNDVTILTGSVPITLGLNQSAVTIASLTISGLFAATIASTAAIPLPLQIGVSGNVIINTTSTNISLDFGSTTPQIIVQATGQASGQQFGQEAFRFRGGGSGCNLYQTGSSSVGIATDTSGITATLTNWNVAAGTLNIASGVTWTNGYQNGGIVNVVTVTGGTATLIDQNGGQIVTSGGGKIDTINVLAQAVISNRPASGAAYDTLNAGPGATADHAQDARPFLVTNAIVAAADSVINFFDAGQAQLVSGPSPIQINMPSGPASVTINMGGQVLASFRAA